MCSSDIGKTAENFLRYSFGFPVSLYDKANNFRVKHIVHLLSNPVYEYLSPVMNTYVAK